MGSRANSRDGLVRFADDADSVVRLVQVGETDDFAHVLPVSDDHSWDSRVLSVVDVEDRVGSGGDALNDDDGDNGNHVATGSVAEVGDDDCLPIMPAKCSDGFRRVPSGNGQVGGAGDVVGMSLADWINERRVVLVSDGHNRDGLIVSVVGDADNGGDDMV